MSYFIHQGLSPSVNVTKHKSLEVDLILLADKLVLSFVTLPLQQEWELCSALASKKCVQPQGSPSPVHPSEGTGAGKGYVLQTNNKPLYKRSGLTSTETLPLLKCPVARKTIPKKFKKCVTRHLGRQVQLLSLCSASWKGHFD